MPTIDRSTTTRFPSNAAVGGSKTAAIGNGMESWAKIGMGEEGTEKVMGSG